MKNPQEYELFIREAIKNKEKMEAIQWLEEKIFLIDMIDTWDENDKMMYEILSKIKQELWVNL